MEFTIVETLQQNLAALQSRHAELTAEQQTAAQQLQDARNAVVDGTGSTEALTTKQSALTAIMGAVSEVAQRIENMRKELTQALAQDARNAKLQRLHSIGAAMSDDLIKFDAVSAEAIEALNNFVPEAAALFRSIVNKQMDFAQLARQVERLPPELHDQGQKISTTEVLSLSGGDLLGRIESQAGDTSGDFFRQALLAAFTRDSLAAAGRAAADRAQAWGQEEALFNREQLAHGTAAKSGAANGVSFG